MKKDIKQLGGFYGLYGNFKYKVLALMGVCALTWLICDNAKPSDNKFRSSNLAISDAEIEEFLQKMTLRQKIGQLMMIQSFAKTDYPDKEVLSLLGDYEVGGLIWMKGQTENLRKLLPVYQKAAALPLWSAMDAEWGAAMRMTDCARYPYATTLGACGDTLLVEDIAHSMGLQLKSLGIQISFGPVADVNSNPFNPVIGYRSFGNNAQMVAAMARAYAKGLEKAGIMSCAKHFPGHGDTESDSHYDLPVVNKSATDLDNMEWKVFKELLNLPSMMSAHLIVNAVDSGLGLPVSLNPAALEGMLRRKWGYQGIIFTDGLTMKGATLCYPPGELEFRAILAGNDVLLCIENVKEAMTRIEQAIDRGEWSEEELNHRVRRILKAKRRYLYAKPISAEYSPKEKLVGKCYRKAITAWGKVNASNELRPNNSRLYLAIGGDEGDPQRAYDRFGIFARADYVQCPWKNSDQNGRVFWKNIADSILPIYQECVVAWHIPSQSYVKGLGMDTPTLRLCLPVLEQYRRKGGRLYHLVFGNPMALGIMHAFENQRGPGIAEDVVIVAHEDQPLAWDAAVQSLFGAIPLEGLENVEMNAVQASVSDSKLKSNPRQSPWLKAIKLPMQWQPLLNAWDGPHQGVFSKELTQKADSMVEAVRLKGAFPGAQLVVAQGQNILYAKSYGFLDNSQSVPVDMGAVYDLASLTKVLSTALAAMDMHRSKPIPLAQKLKTLLPELKNHPLGQRTLASLMTHQAGLVSHMAIDQKLAEDLKAASQREKGKKRSMLDVLLQRSLTLPLGPDGKYLYSDLSLLWVDRWLETEFKARGIQDYRKNLREKWYEPCGASRLVYRPLDKFPISRVAPTEMDVSWRKKLIQGEVHDPMAYVMGGIAPHAGLFGTATDVARILMPLVTGYFPGSAKVDSATLALFTSSYFPGNRRGLLWDRPIPGSSQAKAPRSFGHSGFTGTYCWVDPETGLIMVFVSNRIHPRSEPNLLAKSNLRTDLWDLFYANIKSTSH